MRDENERRAGNRAPDQAGAGFVDGETQQSRGMSLTLSDWFYEGILMDNGLLSIDPMYFTITGGRERWLYRVARGGRGSPRPCNC